MLTGFDSGYLHCDQTSELSPLTQWASCQEKSILRTMPFWKKKRNLKKIPATSEQGKAPFCTDRPGCVEQRWMRSTARKAGEAGLQHAHTLALSPWRHFFSSLLPPPPPTILKWLCMSHASTSKHRHHAFPYSMPKLHHPSRLYFQEITRIWCLHTRDTEVYMLPLPDNSWEMLLALPLPGSTFPMLVCCMVGESETNPSATLTSPPVNSLW